MFRTHEMTAKRELESGVKLRGCSREKFRRFFSSSFEGGAFRTAVMTVLSLSFGY